MSRPGLVVAGAGLAGVRAVEAARRAGFQGAITVLGAEDEAPYDRPPLSKAFLTGPAEVKVLATVDRLRDDLGADVRLGVTVTGLDPDARTVTAGQDFPYARVIIATGSTARELPGTGGVAGVHTLRTHGDAVALRSALTAGRRLVVVGGGFIGSEVAWSARQLGGEVTIVEAASVPLARAVGDEMGAALARLHVRRGIDVRCGSGVDALVGDAAVTGVRLVGGEVLPADLVLVGVGAVPALTWLAGSGLQVDDGVVCDQTLRAGPGVYAAGDVARWLNPTFDRVMRLEHWTSAAEQGAIAGRNAADPDAAVACGTVPYFWSDWGADRIQLVGLAEADEVVVASGTAEGGDLLALYRSGDRVIGALGVNQARIVLRLRMLIGQGADWSQALDLVRAGLPTRP